MQEAQRTVVNTPDAAQPIGAYSQAIRVKAGELLFIAGQVAYDTNGNLVERGDVAAQTRQVFENIGQILASAGASFTDVAEFTTYLVGKESVQPYLEARSELFQTFFPDGDYPANTLLIVDGLVREELLIEVKAVAGLG